MVAVGNLKKVWTEFPQDYSEEVFTEEFKGYFGAEWNEVLDAVDMSFAYNSYNTLYFAVRDIEGIENLKLDQLMEEKGIYQPPNVVVS